MFWAWPKCYSLKGGWIDLIGLLSSVSLVHPFSITLTIYGPVYKYKSIGPYGLTQWNVRLFMNTPDPLLLLAGILHSTTSIKRPITLVWGVNFSILCDEKHRLRFNPYKSIGVGSILTLVYEIIFVLLSTPLVAYIMFRCHQRWRGFLSDVKRIDSGGVKRIISLFFHFYVESRERFILGNA